ncbi:MAG: 16S rRNA (guanine(527)-N(7))-methyltransferase RsmG [Desulfarculaceae bacterium]|nr:16S rRNA (guanine(527)-N(7))-methyltransferase RsmG [Desulfarculaceae bacterium]MCF8073624.1 16S rRNA (guanine(527)-N(7))-methyltransferase RsmG [Desulfarculaceae bacterium]MCF8103144.1 16S rRNA (guanine(527)-N(7))-methyltransferase RsmG [Desulfarculaceae bacterium]MCF8115660.1 16S rRNA (guanine(527)-N(7))-methyltransferase RsmG [Desulfarculaceae bacterium]
MEHIAKRLAGRALPNRLGCDWDSLSELLLKWNQTHNLTGHSDPISAKEDLFLDSLALVPQVRGGTLLDIGSGAGFPGLVLALALPELQVTLLEPRAKRISFQKHAVRTLGLEGRVRPVQGRAGEALLDQRFDTITLRAVTDIPGSLDLARPYLAQGGAVLLPRGKKDAAQARELGLEVVEYTLGDKSEPRIIAIYFK